MLLSFRMPPCVVYESYVTESGVFKVFLGTHYHKGRLCWLVGFTDKRNGNISMRHYNELCEGSFAPKPEAFSYWEELKEKLKLIGETKDEHEEISNQLKYYIERAEEQN